MRTLFRTFRSGYRMTVGGLRLPAAFIRGRNMSKWKVISVDVFGTLLVRLTDDEAVWREGALQTIEIARALNLSVQTEPLNFRRTIEQRLSKEAIMRGRDPEFSHKQVIEEMLKELGAGDWRHKQAAELASWELKREGATTIPIAAMVAWVRNWTNAGMRVVAVSDTRYTAEELAILLSRHRISGLTSIYSSADYGASKFSGKLFDLVAQRECAKPRQILHIGDSLTTDHLAAAQRGLAVRPVYLLNTPQSLPDAPVNRSGSEDPAFMVGYKTLGPILVAFVRLLFHQAHRDGVRRLAFVARDGELLFQQAQILAAKNDDYRMLEMRYLHLSRRAVAGASSYLQHLHQDSGAIEQVIATLRSIRDMGTAMESFRSFFNVPSELIQRHTERLHAESGDETDVRRLLGDNIVATELAEVFVNIRERLRRYLIQEDILNEDSALVDIGWCGSLQKIIQSECRIWQLPSPRGYYLGLWNENDRDFPPDSVGLLCDQRRGSGLYEGSAWHAAFFLEAVCRAKHGMVSGLAEDTNGTIHPLHVEAGGTREAEQRTESLQNLVQEGVLAYTRWYAETSPMTVTDERSIRKEAQRRLYQLAFFPSKDERTIGQHLIYSEPTSNESAMCLITDKGVGLSGWFSGLRSPWKGGYLQEHGGYWLAILYCGIEGLFSRMPPGTKTAIRRLLLRHH